MVALGAEAPAVGVGDLVALLVEEIDVIDLLDRAAGEPGLVLDQVLELGLGRDLVVALTGLCQFQSAPDHIAWTPGRPPT